MGGILSKEGEMDNQLPENATKLKYNYAKVLKYNITEVTVVELLNKFGKYMTSILNDGDGGVIILKIRANIDVLVGQIKEEISKIRPCVQDKEYRITTKRENGDIGEIQVDIEPVPWGIDEYAAADGNVYTPDILEPFVTDEHVIASQPGSCICTTVTNAHKPNRETGINVTNSACDMETHNDCELPEITQEKRDKNTGTPHSDIKDVIHNCVKDLRDIKSKLGISNRSGRIPKIGTLKITSEDGNSISVSQEQKTDIRLHHSKSMSDYYSDAENHQSHLKRKYDYLIDTSEIKTLCEDFPLNPCNESNNCLTVNETLIQVDGEGYKDDIDHRESDTEYLLPQLDGLYDEVTIIKEEMDSDDVNDGILDYLTQKDGVDIMARKEKEYSVAIEAEEDTTLTSIDGYSVANENDLVGITKIRLRIIVAQADLPTYQCDAIVNANNESLEHAGRQARAIVNKGILDYLTQKDGVDIIARKQKGYSIAIEAEEDTTLPSMDVYSVANENDPVGMKKIRWRIIVAEVDLPTYKCDAIVNASNETLEHAGRQARAIVNKVVCRVGRCTNIIHAAEKLGGHHKMFFHAITQQHFPVEDVNVADLTELNKTKYFQAKTQHYKTLGVFNNKLNVAQAEFIRSLDIRRIKLEPYTRADRTMRNLDIDNIVKGVEGKSRHVGYIIYKKRRISKVPAIGDLEDNNVQPQWSVIPRSSSHYSIVVSMVKPVRASATRLHRIVGVMCDDNGGSAYKRKIYKELETELHQGMLAEKTKLQSEKKRRSEDKNRQKIEQRITTLGVLSEYSLNEKFQHHISKLQKGLNIPESRLLRQER